MKIDEASFRKDVAQHQVEVILNNGTHRHLRCRRPGTYCMGFDVVTYPGFLCYSGDMGCFVFSRLPDMFEFFRSGVLRDGSLRINEGYWAEKLEAVDSHTSTPGAKVYDPEKFRQVIGDRLKEAVDAGDITQDAADLAADELLPVADDGEDAAHRAVHAYNHGDAGFEFTDFFESNLRSYTHRFRWCLYAILWAIQQFDAVTVEAAA